MATRRSDEAERIKRDIALAAQAGFPYYVYTLADQAGIFYVGKGTRFRVFHHERMYRSERNGAKVERILACGKAGPLKAIVAFFRAEGDAYDLERTLIAETVDLTNMARGQQSAREARMAWARSRLAMLKPLVQWLGTMPPGARAWCEKHYHSPEDFYRKWVEEMTNESIDPTPVEIRVNLDGSHTMVW